MVKGSFGVCATLDVATNNELTSAAVNLMGEKSFSASEPSVGSAPFLSGGIPYTPAGTFVAAARPGDTHRETGGSVAEIRIEEKKRGAPWLLILLLLVVAAVIGWWLWSHRSAGSDTTNTPSGVVTDSTAAKKNP